ncbi:MAG: DUF3710 domain-containing protein [Streptosporangiaceae bacterium]
MFRRHHREEADQSRHDIDDELDQQGLEDELAELAELAEADDDESEREPDSDGELDGELLDEPGQASPVADGRAAVHDLGDPATWTRLRDRVAPGPVGPGQSAGPWDSASDYPQAERMDFGSLLLPAPPGYDIQVNLDEQAGMWIAVVHQNSALQLQAFAAPRTSGLWDEVRAEIAGEVAKSGGRSEEAQGPFGTELVAQVATLDPEGDPSIPVVHTLRFMGANGPRWFLRGLLSGPAAQSPEMARPFEEVFANVVVVRGDHAQPPRKSLDIRLPEAARQAIEQQMEAEQNGLRTDQQGMPVNPFERGPEITETR